MRKQLELDNAVAAELAGMQDAILRALEAHLDCDVFLRGNVLTLDGDDDGGARPATEVVRELSDLIEQGHEITAGTIEAVTRALDAHTSPGGDPGGRRLAPPDLEGGAEDGQPEALRRLDPRQHGHLRDRSGGHRQDVPRRRAGRGRALPARGQPDHPHPPGGGGRRAARLPARRPDGEGRSLPAPAVRRPARHARARAGQPVPRARDDRGGAAGVHAREDAQRQLHHPRRGPEHEPGADEDVPHPARVRLQDGGHRRRHPDRPAARAGLGAGRRRRRAGARWRASGSSGSATRTSCGTSSCAGSSPPTTSTPSAWRPSCARASA